MRIVFMGTPQFAVPSLREVTKEHEVLTVVTQPDRKKGRGHKMSYSPVKTWALQNNLPIMQPERLDTTTVMDEIVKLQPELCVVVAFGQKIPLWLLELPAHGCINVHSSLLPKYRGAAPINEAIIQGETVTGVTTMYLNNEWDAGDLILQQEEPILPQDTAGTLHDRLMKKGALLLKETLRQIAQGRAPRIPQNHAKATFAPKLTKEAGHVDFSLSAPQLANLIRGMNPWPGAYSKIKNETVKIWQAKVIEQGDDSPGRILSIDSGGLLVSSGQGSLLLQKLQRPNGKIVSGREFANGLRLAIGDILIERRN